MSLSRGPSGAPCVDLTLLSQNELSSIVGRQETRGLPVCLRS
jgi:hypothetical protein